jgi:rhodanese-related sulfurtransferase
MRYDLAAVLVMKHYLIQLFCITLFAVSCAQRQAAVRIDPVVDAEEQLPTVTVEALKNRIAAGTATFILDVRTPEEYDGPLGRIEGSRLIPVQELAQRLGELADVKEGPIFVICHSGGRSARATRMLLEAGFLANNVAGGMQAWDKLVGKQSESKRNPD